MFCHFGQSNSHIEPEAPDTPRHFYNYVTGRNALQFQAIVAANSAFSLTTLDISASWTDSGGK